MTKVNLLQRASRMERATWTNLAAWVARRPAIPAGATGFSYASAQQPVIIAFIAVSMIEIPVAHLLIPWLWLQLPVLIIGIWGLLWMFGFLAAVRRHPHLVDETGVRIRHSAAADLFVPWDAIDRVSQRLRSLDSSRAVQQEQTPDGTTVIIGVTSQTNLELRFVRPVEFDLPTGPVTAVGIRCYADDPAAMAAAIRTKIPERAQPGGTSGRSSHARPMSRRR